MKPQRLNVDLAGLGRVIQDLTEGHGPIQYGLFGESLHVRSDLVFGTGERFVVFLSRAQTRFLRSHRERVDLAREYASVDEPDTSDHRSRIASLLGLPTDTSWSDLEAVISGEHATAVGVEQTRRAGATPAAPDAALDLLDEVLTCWPDHMTDDGQLAYRSEEVGVYVLEDWRETANALRGGL